MVAWSEEGTARPLSSFKPADFPPAPTFEELRSRPRYLRCGWERDGDFPSPLLGMRPPYFFAQAFPPLLQFWFLTTFSSCGFWPLQQYFCLSLLLGQKNRFRARRQIKPAFLSISPAILSSIPPPPFSFSFNGRLAGQTLPTNEFRGNLHLLAIKRWR